MKTILVLDDDVSVTDLLRTILTKRGYSVLEANTPESAIQWPSRCEACIDLFITDILLPRTSGIAVALQLRAEKPEVGVLLMSGYPLVFAEDRYRTEFDQLSRARVVFLQKPFSPRTLVEKVEALIGTAGNDEHASAGGLD